MEAANAEMVAVNAEMEAAISKMEAAKAEIEAAISKMEAAKVEMEAANASMEGNTLLMRTFINMLKIIIWIVVPFSDCVVPSVLLENMTLCRVNNFPRPTDPMDPLKSDNQISDDYIIDDIQKMIDVKTPPVNVMIPTSDGDFEEIVSKLKKHGHTFLLAYNDDRNAEGDLPSQVLVSLADQSWGWRTFLGLGKSSTDANVQILCSDHVTACGTLMSLRMITCVTAVSGSKSSACSYVILNR
ncbi:hypothetical protein IGI04_002112 [Brassica rapa subsp. trilocularis]|uniref:Uncharacterized protein n=1 Tax=Brassica rapa subsp. trilocularis TaxID=1813537 RepID=A0ABQ7NUL1_BRACM|nr:hypothetical protein IGI04_002112 [Brassica rapa subsp. trilocularis]